MALIHQNLYQEDNLTGVDIKEYFTKLVRGLFDSYNIRRDQVTLSLDIRDLNLNVDSAIPIG
ncbi:MAG: two-component sensor histidine kinase [Saprospiraceae bacterium]|jgi:two-component sensor histidine kinase